MSRPLLAEFDDPRALVGAARALVERGHTRIRAYSPVPIEGLDAVLPPPEGGGWRTSIARLTFVGGLLGGGAIFLFQVWAMAWDWTLDVGGRRPFSWPAFIVPTFECTILGAALTAFIAFMLMSGFPRPHHPVFEFAAFERASADRLFLCIDLDEPGFAADDVIALFEGHAPVEVHELPQ